MKAVFCVSLCALLCASAVRADSLRPHRREDDDHDDATAVAHFDMNGVRGYVVFQRNATTLRITCNVTGIVTDDVIMEIRQLPLYPGQSGSPCGNVGRTFNPTEAGNTSKTLAGGSSSEEEEGEEDEDEYLGSLSKRLNFTLKSDSPTTRYDRSELKLFGRFGVVGRSVVLRGSHGGAFACANIVHVKNTANRQCGATNNQNKHETLRATFHGQVSGTVMIRRLDGAATGDATVVSHLYYTDKEAMSTTNHTLQIRQNSVGQKGWPCTAAALGAVAHDFSGTLSVGHSPSADDAREVISGVDISGTFNMLAEKSLAIFDSENPTIAIACADVHVLAPQKLVAEFGTIRVSLEQMSPFDSTSVDIDFGENDVRSFGISKYPAPSDGSCSQDWQKQMFDPFGKESASNVPGLTPDRYPVGYLSEKFRSRGLSRKFHICDDNLPLFGVNSVSGRAMYFLRNDGAPSCANLTESLTNGGMLLKAKATFRDQQGGKVVGTIFLQQRKYADGSLGETTIDTTGLRNSDGVPTSKHNYHVHIRRKGFQRNVTACGGHYAQGHYNPWPVNVSTAGLPYKTDCNKENQLRCELGDTSRKSGQLDLDGSQTHRHDRFMPLEGPFTVLGRSFVIHNPNGGAPRYACANIIPASAHDVQIGFDKSRLNGRPFDKAEFEQKVNAVASRSGRSVSVLYAAANGEDQAGCMYVSVAIDGEHSHEVAQQLYTADLGSYTQSTLCINFAAETTNTGGGSGASSTAISILSIVASAAVALNMC